MHYFIMRTPHSFSISKCRKCLVRKWLLLFYCRQVFHKSRKNSSLADPGKWKKEMKSGLYNTLFYCGIYFSTRILWDDWIKYNIQYLCFYNVLYCHFSSPTTPATSVEIYIASHLTHTNMPLYSPHWVLLHLTANLNKKKKNPYSTEITSRF